MGRVVERQVHAPHLSRPGSGEQEGQEREDDEGGQCPTPGAGAPGRRGRGGGGSRHVRTLGRDPPGGKGHHTARRLPRTRRRGNVEDTPPTPRPMNRFRRYFLEGLALVVPVSITLWVLWWLFTRLDGILGEVLVPVFGRHVPGLGIVVLVALLVAIGWLTERALGRRATQLWEKLVVRVPVARPVYRGTRRMLQSLVEQDSQSFKRAVLCEYPGPGIWSIAFVTGAAPEQLLGDVGEDAVTVFLPTAPNPMSGFLLVVPVEKTRPLAAPVESAFTFVVSMGAVPMTEVDAGSVAATAEPRPEG